MSEPTVDTRRLNRARQALGNAMPYKGLQFTAVMMHFNGDAPSDIDAALGFPAGTARELIVAYWYRGWIRE